MSFFRNCKFKCLAFCSLPFFVGGVEVQPWFGDIYEFHFLGKYTYSYFERVQRGIPQLTSPFHVNLAYLGLDFSPTPDWSIDMDIQFADTSKQSFNFRTIALQARYLWLDDMVGDRVSFATGASVRGTPRWSLKDVSCPSHGYTDFELNFSLGREFDPTDSWRWRLWGFGAIGQANLGSPWLKAIAAIETNYDDRHKWAFFAEAIHGYGRQLNVYNNRFHGYAKIRSRSIDLSVRYGYRMGVWGTVRFEYSRRVLAKSCPEEVNSFLFSYLLPFSF